MWFEGPYDCLFHLEFFDCLPLSLYVFVAYDPFICNLWVLNIVCFPPTTYHCICVFICTHLLRSTHFLEDNLLYLLSKLFVHFGPFWQLMPMGEKFREFTLDMFRGFCFYCVSIYILHTCIITLYVCAWLCLFPYINSLEVVVFNYENGGDC